jgi:hypothetical protein
MPPVDPRESTRERREIGEQQLAGEQSARCASGRGHTPCGTGLGYSAAYVRLYVQKERLLIGSRCQERRVDAAGEQQDLIEPRLSGL